MNKDTLPPESGRSRAGLFFGLYVAAVLSAPAIGMLSGQAWDGMRLPYQIGRVFALTGFMILFLQVALTGRFKIVEREFGLDVLARFHRWMAVVAFALLLCHPILLALGGWGIKLLTGIALPWPIWVGKTAFTLLAINAVISLLRTKLSIRFETWRLAHDLLGPGILLLAFVHSWFMKGGFPGSPLAVIWPVVFLGAVSLFAWHRLLRPYLASRHPYTVAAVRQEAKGVWTLELTPPGGRPAYDYLPGQFHFLTLLRGPGLPEEEHHFTISSSPTQKGFVTSTIKDLGDFTSTIKSTKPGDKAVVQAPFGRFSYLLHPEDRDLVFLCGGIGITPLMSMLRHMRDTGAEMPVTLLYANHGEEDIVFRQELAEMEAGGRPRLKVIHVLSHPRPEWQGEKGHVDEAVLRRLLGDTAGKTFYLCGPPAMAKSLLDLLKKFGVEKERIRWEQFALVD